MFLGIFFLGCRDTSNTSAETSLASDTTLSLEAREWSKKIDKSPNVARYYVQRAEVLLKEKRFDLAIADYLKSIELEPNDAVIHYQLGDAYFAADSTTNALAYYKKAENINPNDVEAVFKHAQFLYFVRQFDNAQIKLGKLINLDPAHANGHFYSAMLHKEKGDTTQAIYFFKKNHRTFGSRL